ncbi:MAG: hypothetical protein WCT03_08990 [Candidatus Obscuribacterales bacterium]
MKILCNRRIRTLIASVALITLFIAVLLGSFTIVRAGAALFAQSTVSAQASPRVDVECEKRECVVVDMCGSGNVRINKLAGLESLANILANGLEILGIGGGIAVILSCLIRGTAFKFEGRTRITFAVIAIIYGLATPGCINWIFSSLLDHVGFS